MKKFLNILILVLAASLVWQSYRAGKLAPLEPLWKSVVAAVNERLAAGKQPVNEATKEQTAVSAQTTPTSGDPSTNSAPASEVTAAATPATASASSAIPVATPSSTPAVTSAITPAPVASVDLSGLERRFWPKQVKLNKAMQFAIAVNGREAGKIGATAGVMVKILDIRGTQLEVELANGSVPKMILAADTDIQDRVREIKSLAGDGTVVARPTASSTPWTPKYNATHK